jgi:hypothetical protein
LLEEEAVDSIRFRRAVAEGSYLPSSPEHARVIAHAVATGVVDQVCHHSSLRIGGPPGDMSVTVPSGPTPGKPDTSLGLFNTSDMHGTALDWLRRKDDPAIPPAVLSPLQASQAIAAVESQLLV